MKAAEAENLIKKAFTNLHQPQVWADLGCGAGTFTRALAGLLPPGSEVHAVDKSSQSLAEMNDHVKITFQKGDFEKDDLMLPEVDGILMANALHYVKDKITFINKIKKQLHSSGELLIIEYDAEAANSWVPYPISFNKLKNMMLQAGFSSIEKMAEVRSVYNNGNIYSCVVRLSEQ